MKVIAILRSDENGLEHICSTKEKCIDHMKQRLEYFIADSDMLEIHYSSILIHPSWYLSEVEFTFYEIEVDTNNAKDIASDIIPSIVEFIDKKGWVYTDTRTRRTIINGKEVPMSQKYPCEYGF